MKKLIIVDVGDEMYTHAKVSLSYKDEDGYWADVNYETLPLRPMPKRYVEDDFVIETPRDAEACTHGIIVGRNIVINEITGETE